MPKYRGGMTTENMFYCGAGRPLEEARARLAELEARHSDGEHFWQWTGRIVEGRGVLGCMFCSLRTLELTAVDAQAA